MAGQLEEIQGSAEGQAHQAERARHQERVDVLEGKLASSGGYAQDPADLRREIEGLKAELAERTQHKRISRRWLSLV